VADLAGRYNAETSPSGSTYMDVDYEVLSRSRIRVYGNIHLGSATSAGSAEERTMKITVNGTVETRVVKALGTYWGPSSNHGFDYTFDFNAATSSTVNAKIDVDATETSHSNPSVTFATGTRTVTIPSSMLKPGQGSTPTVSPSSAPETTITIEWAATQYATAYYVEYYKSGSWYRLKAVSGTSTTTDLSAVAARGETIGWSIVPYNSYGSGTRSGTRNVTRNRVPNTLASAPTPNATLIEPGTTIRLSFTNAGDPDGNLSGYEAAMQNSAGQWHTDASGNIKIVGSRAGAFIDYVDVYTTGWTRGGKWKFFVRGYDVRGIRGSWSPASALVTVNSAPPVPESISVTPSPFEKAVTVSWAAVTDPDNNLKHYELQRRISADGTTWGAWETVATQTARTFTEEPPVEDEGKVQYQVRAVDTFDQVSDWRTSAQVRREDGSGLVILQGGVEVKTDIIIGETKYECWVMKNGQWVETKK